MKQVTIYALSTCPWCMKTKRFFESRNIPCEVIEYDLADTETQHRIMCEMDKLGESGFPVVKIGDEVVCGYNPEQFEKALES